MCDLSYSQLVRRQTGLMNRMMARLGVDPAVAATVDGSLAWYEARTKCLFCSKVPQCFAWLEGAQPQPVPIQFCPNIVFFQDCLSRARKHRAIAPTS
jgi:hypothetical protein